MYSGRFFETKWFLEILRQSLFCRLEARTAINALGENVAHGNSLEGKNALVTGGAKRLGRAIALRLAESGVRVAVHCKSSREEAQRLADEIKGRGGEAWCLGADLSMPGAAEKLFDDAVALCGRIDFLVNNASIFPAQGLSALDESTLLENVRINSLAPFALTKAMHAQGVEGAVVNMLDTRILDFDAAHVPYHLSKRLLFELTKISALEFAPLLRVNAVAPGLILPPPGKDESYLQNLADNLPLKRVGTGEEVAHAAVLLLSMAFTTGQVVYVDGGRHLTSQLYG